MPNVRFSSTSMAHFVLAAE